MKISVDEQTKRFYLASTNWVPLVGHEIKVGNYRFSAVFTNNQLVVSEVTSGTKVFSEPLNLALAMSTSTKEDTMLYFEKVLGKRLDYLIQNRTDFDKIIEKARGNADDRLGNMPTIEYVDTDWIFEEVSDVLN